MTCATSDLAGRLALVTGAGQGIGAACARALGEAGAEIICTDLPAARAEATAADLQAAGLRAQGKALDVTDTTALAALAASLPPLDILVCNAGIVSNTPAEDMEDAEWQRVLDVNLTGVFKTCRRPPRFLTRPSPAGPTRLPAKLPAPVANRGTALGSDA